MITIKHNAFSQNLGNDFIAVDDKGNILARASTEEACRQAVPFATAIYGAKDLTGPLESAGVDYAAAEAASAGAVAEVRADISTFLHDQRVAGEIDPAVAVEAEAPIGSGLEIEPETPVEPEQPVVAEAPDLQKAKAAGKLDNYTPMPKAKTVDKFDHDDDGHSGGSKKGAESTAHKGAENRKRKPAGK